MNGPNLLSLLRIAMTPLAAVLVARGSPAAYPVIAVALLTDFLDGWTARRFGESTPLGRILDPVADKVFAGGILVALAATSRIPWEIATLVVVRDAVLLAVSWLKIRSGEPVPAANLLGKIAFAALGGYLLATALGLALPTWAGGAVAAGYIASGFSYAGRAPALLPRGVAKEPR